MILVCLSLESTALPFRLGFLQVVIDYRDLGPNTAAIDIATEAELASSATALELGESSDRPANLRIFHYD
jgi:hypothetical protein